MRDFLLDKKIVGAMMVSRCGSILDCTIPEILKWCDYLVIMFDFPDQRTREIVQKHVDNNPGQIETFESGVPNYIGEKNKEFFEESEQGMFKRFNALQGVIRERMLGHIQDKLRAGEQIDILVWLDSDEILCYSMEKTLIDFANNYKKHGLLLRSVEVFDRFDIILPASMNAHTRIIKPSLCQHIQPYRGLAQIWGITKPMKQRCLYSYAHCQMLTMEKRLWRREHWRARNMEKYFNIS